MSASFSPVAETARYIDSLGPEALAKAHAYSTGSNWLIILGPAVSVLVAWLIIRSGLLDRLTTRLSGRKWALMTFLVSAAALALTDLLSLPWTLYTSWHRQRSYGLSSQSLGDFLGQWVIGELVFISIFSLFMLGVYALIRRTGRRWWLWGGALAVVSMTLFLLAGPSLIDPLFNKYEPVPQGEVRTALEEIADDVGIPQDRIFMFDGSRQSERFTANVAGLGPTARIAISDVALKEASLPEVRAVTGHEAGHFKLGHIWRSVVLFPSIALAVFFLLNWLFAPAARLLGSDAQLGEARGLPVFVAVSWVLGIFAVPVVNSVSRIGEIEADAYSLATVGEPNGLASALVKTLEYRYPRPSRLEEVLFYSHPSGENRIRAAMEWKAANQGATPPAQ